MSAPLTLLLRLKYHNTFHLPVWRHSFFFQVIFSVLCNRTKHVLFSVAVSGGEGSTRERGRQKISEPQWFRASLAQSAGVVLCQQPGRQIALGCQLCRRLAPQCLAAWISTISKVICKIWTEIWRAFHTGALFMWWAGGGNGNLETLAWLMEPFGWPGHAAEPQAICVGSPRAAPATNRVKRLSPRHL